MRLFIAYELNQSGKGNFLRRLIPELEKLGVSCQFEESGADVALLISHFRGPIADALPKVIRMDGVPLLDTARQRWWARSRTRPALEQCDAVIYQSAFARQVLTELVGVHHRHEYVIHNGADPAAYDVPPAPSPFARNVILCAKWHSRAERPNKRLREMVEIARGYSRADTGFWVLGETGGYTVEHDRIRFVGHLSQPELARYYRLADVMLNLGWFDWCPNAVVEALAAGVPVICSNHGGVAELVRDRGWVLPLDAEGPLARLRTTRPPDFVPDSVVRTLDEALERPWVVHAPDLHVERIAHDYRRVLQEVVSRGRRRAVHRRSTSRRA